MVKKSTKMGNTSKKPFEKHKRTAKKPGDTNKGSKKRGGGGGSHRGWFVEKIAEPAGFW